MPTRVSAGVGNHPFLKDGVLINLQKLSVPINGWEHTTSELCEIWIVCFLFVLPTVLLPSQQH